MKTEEYNGWTNRVTWLIPLWFNPQTTADVDYLENELEADCFDLIKSHGDNMLADLVWDMVDFSQVNWQEIREAVEANENG